MTSVRVFPDADELGGALAEEIALGIHEAGLAGRPYVLGCPGGRSGRPVYEALAHLLRGARLDHLVIAMMDEYVVPAADGAWAHVPADAHYSCRRFAIDEIVAPLDAVARTSLRPEHVWLPDPGDPEGYTRRLAEAGGVDHFIVASGASDGHVAFNKPGTPLDGGPAVIELAESTRRDNMVTFPRFGSLAEIPTHGVSVGLGTIREVSRRVTLILHGADKRITAARVLEVTDFDPAWPATFIHRCPEGRVWLDEAARPDGR